MPRRFHFSLIAACLIAAHDTALADCPPAVAARSAEDIGSKIDHYWLDPRAPETYRAQAGMGDPSVEADDHDGHYWNASGPRRALIARMLPDQSNPEEQYFYAQPGNCRIDYALEIAEARIAGLGANHPYVAQWMRVQRAVFSACRNQGYSASDNPTPAATELPPAMATDDPAIARLQRADRAYQAASLLFYRDAPGAAAAFRAIAGSTSPHAHIARYMQLAIAARNVAATGFDQPRASEAERATRARAAMAQARAILADPGLRDIHPLAQGMIGFLGYWTGDGAVRTAQIGATLDALEAPLARIISDSVARDRYSRAASDIVWLRRDVPRAGWSGSDEDTPTGSSVVRALSARAPRDPLAAWLLTGVSPYERESWILNRYAFGYASYWLSQRDDQHPGPGRVWEVVRAEVGGTYDPANWANIDALVRDAAACPSDDRLAAAPRLFYHQVRAALMYPVRDAEMAPLARQEGYPAALERVRSWPWRDSAYYRTLVADMLRYLVAGGRVADARTLRDQIDLRAGEQQGNMTALVLLAESEDQLVHEIVARPDGGQRMINLLPIAVLARLAGREELPAPVRARFARTAWTRLYALQRPIPRPLDTLMRRLNPEITGGWTSRAGAGPDDRPLLLDMLRSPGMNIVITDHQRGSNDNMGYSDLPTLTSIDTFEHSDNNWWCAWQPDRHRITASAIMYGAFFRPEGDWIPMAAAGATSALGPLLRVSWLWQAQDHEEQATLAEVQSAPRLLAERAIAWRGHGNGAGQDEALALAIRATRYGCQRQGGHGQYSHAAWDLLHTRFPTSDAARRTRWWFDCAHFSGGCAALRPDDVPDWERWAGWSYNY